MTDNIMIEWNGIMHEVDPAQRVFITNDEDVKSAIMYMPGYDQLVIIHLDGPHPVWGWNGDIYSPTFTPSILSETDRWDGTKYVPMRNHVFVRDGVIQYLSDCRHRYAGVNMELPRLRDWPEDMRLFGESQAEEDTNV